MSNIPTNHLFGPNPFSPINQSNTNNKPIKNFDSIRKTDSASAFLNEGLVQNEPNHNLLGKNYSLLFPNHQNETETTTDKPIQSTQEESNELLTEENIEFDFLSEINDTGNEKSSLKTLEETNTAPEIQISNQENDPIRTLLEKNLGVPEFSPEKLQLPESEKNIIGNQVKEYQKTSIEIKNNIRIETGPNLLLTAKARFLEMVKNTPEKVEVTDIYMLNIDTDEVFIGEGHEQHAQTLLAQRYPDRIFSAYILTQEEYAVFHTEVKNILETQNQTENTIHKTSDTNKSDEKIIPSSSQRKKTPKKSTELNTPNLKDLDESLKKHEELKTVRKNADKKIEQERDRKREAWLIIENSIKINTLETKKEIEKKEIQTCSITQVESPRKKRVS